jgi:predicted DNA-binding WGR domain protein
MSIRRFEYKQGPSSKFWEIKIDTNTKTLTTTWGRIGTSGTSNNKSFTDITELSKEYASLINGKLNKGYKEVVPQPSQTTNGSFLNPELAVTLGEDLINSIKSDVIGSVYQSSTDTKKLDFYFTHNARNKTSHVDNRGAIEDTLTKHLENYRDIVKRVSVNRKRISLTLREKGVYVFLRDLPDIRRILKN